MDSQSNFKKADMYLNCIMNVLPANCNIHYMSPTHIHMCTHWMEVYIYLLFRENKLQDKVILIKGEVEQLQLPVDKVTNQLSVIL